MKSQTLGSDGMHTQGVVLGEIVKANIPVRNGVVHLIHRPLVIVDTTVVQLLEVSGWIVIVFECILSSKDILLIALDAFWAAAASGE